jgi:hypothetical protein
MLRFLLVEAAQVTGEPDARINNDPYCRHVNESASGETQGTAQRVSTVHMTKGCRA